MKPIRPSADVCSLSEFRANVASLVQQVQKTRRPLVLTVHGPGAAVLLDAGRSLPHEDVKRRIRKRLGR